jgi:hypothetical protein
MVVAQSCYRSGFKMEVEDSEPAGVGAVVQDTFGSRLR